MSDRKQGLSTDAAKTSALLTSWQLLKTEGLGFRVHSA